MRLNQIALMIGLTFLVAGCAQHRTEGPGAIGTWGGVIRPVPMRDADGNQVMVAGLALDEGILPSHMASTEDPHPTDVPLLLSEDGKTYSPTAFEANSQILVTGELRKFSVRSPLGDRILGNGPVWAIKVQAQLR
jgi:hypothetical protein